ncbi:DUF4040 domain-containing protein [Egibacter rhizosphaerae]|uniref:DUF4040 domain-containing protein n=1 Tax=Egibacter rhizosphaerae TaxID=1670831 RepID=A0A411YE71_9ACTN|nr:hydrogen gas-evolving membrane-bound hydrogenase subunit E [Egibacter rhizosphaerae]QBI19515.1 DUF4040 domain-containing protein [Egibacter rhizosphaerae]
MILVGVLAATFLAAAIAKPLATAMGRDAGWLLAGVLAVFTVLVATEVPGVVAGEPVTGELAWIPSADLTLALRMDGLGLLFSLIVLGIGALVLAYSARYFGTDRAKAGRFLALLTFFAASMLGLVLADDLIALFVFWEFTSVSSFFLIGGKGEGAQGATRAFLVTAVGGLALLAGFVLLGLAADTFVLSEILRSPEAVLAAPTMPAIVVLILLGAFTKSAQFPFHFWLPGAMVAPTPVSTYLHAATMVKAGIYLLFRLTPVFGGEPVWQVPLVLFGLGTALLGAVVATKANDLKRLLAYGTVSQLGFLTGLIGIGTPLALGAAGVHLFAHALYKATLFMSVGIVDHETGTRDLRELGGLRADMPRTALAGGLAAVSMAGLPPLLGFVSKEEAFAAFVESPGAAWLAPTSATLAVAASVFTFAYSARYYWRTFEGPLRTHAHAPPLSFEAAPLLLGVAGLALGLVVPLLSPYANVVGLDTTGESPEFGLSLWHGLTLPLLMSAIVVGGGIALFLTRERVERLQGRVRLPIDGEGTFDRLYDQSIALGKRIGAPAASSSIAVHVAPVLVVLAVGGTAVALAADLTTAQPPAPHEPLDWGIVALLVLSIAGMAQAKSRVGAVAMLGLTGFLIAAWFVQIGAPDLALTQLLVETLTVALVVLVFRRLPPDFLRVRRPRVAGAGVIAAVVGALAFAGTYLLTGRRGESDPAAYYLAEAEEVTGGSNVVNTILVDFRALDTLGEVGVLAIAAAGMYALVRLVPDGRARAQPGEEPRDVDPYSGAAPGDDGDADEGEEVTR